MASPAQPVEAGEETGRRRIHRDSLSRRRSCQLTLDRAAGRPGEQAALLSQDPRPARALPEACDVHAHPVERRSGSPPASGPARFALTTTTSAAAASWQNRAQQQDRRRVARGRRSAPPTDQRCRGDVLLARVLAEQQVVEHARAIGAADAAPKPAFSTSSPARCAARQWREGGVGAWSRCRSSTLRASYFSSQRSRSPAPCRLHRRSWHDALNEERPGRRCGVLRHAIQALVDEGDVVRIQEQQLSSAPRPETRHCWRVSRSISRTGRGVALAAGGNHGGGLRICSIVNAL